MESNASKNYYQATANAYPMIGTIECDHDIDICIIGAGITGLTAAIELSALGYSVVVVEQETIGAGGSGRSGGQVLIGYNESLSTLVERYGQCTANQLWQMSEEALSITRDYIDRYDIDCDLREGQLCLTRTTTGLANYVKYQHEMEEQGVEATILTGDDLTDKIDTNYYIAGLYEKNSFHLHPLNYTLGLANAAIKNGAQIFHQSPVTAIDLKQSRVNVGTFTIKASQIILAGNALIGNLTPGLAKSMVPVTSHIIATQILDHNPIPANPACSDDVTLLNYFRMSADGRLLFGGRPGIFSKNPEDCKRIMRQRMLRVFPQLKSAEIDWSWSGMVGVTQPQIPQLKRLQPNVWVAQGYSGHGMALSGLAGNLVASAINGNSEKFEIFEGIEHTNFPASNRIRSGIAHLGMMWHQAREILGR